MKKFFLVLPLIILFGCSEDPVNLEDTLILNPAYKSDFVTDTLYASFDTTYSIRPYANTINSSRLLIGSYQQFTFRPILCFNFVPSNFSVEEATIEFPPLEIRGENPEPFTVTAYPVTKEWTSNTDSVWMEYPSIINYNRPIGTMTVTTDTSDTMVLALTDTALLNQWADSVGAEENFGFILEFESANFMKSFSAGNNLNVSFRLEGEDSIRTDFVTIFDAFLIQGDFQISENRNYISTLRPMGTVVTFDFTPIQEAYPEGVVINSANLQMAVDHENSVFSPSFDPIMQIIRLQSEPASSEIKLDSTFQLTSIAYVDFQRFTSDSLFIEVQNNNERVELAQNFVQQKLRNPELFEGIFIQYRNQIDFLSYVSFFKRNADDPAKRPKLILKYTVPPKPRF